jgi:hypothetical protein
LLDLRHRLLVARVYPHFHTDGCAVHCPHTTQGSMVQIAIATAVVIAHVILLAHFKPFKRLKHTLLALFTYG